MRLVDMVNLKIIKTIFFCLSLLPGLLLAESRGLSIVDKSGAKVGGYGASYALVVGASDYVAGWPDLNSVPSELDDVSALLTRKGFAVTRINNPTSDQLEEGFENFIDDYGYEENNRLLFYFAGHGFTRDSGNKGYLVPVDAPIPTLDEKGFLRKALAMTDLLALARKMESNHALFLFDSCFSGTIFKTRAITTEVPLIDRLTSKPVRQFITAGDAGEEVPARSVFTPAFIDSLEYGLGDLNSDGFVTGTELGLYLQTKVASHAAQTPQFGKISDYELSRGDFVFTVKRSEPAQADDEPENILQDRGVSGHWKGRYYYEDGRQSVPFYADLFETETGFEGKISEPNTFASGQTTSLTADMRGRLNGNEIWFRKTYDGRGGQSHSIDYKGVISEDGLSVNGRWQLSGSSGRFELYRR